MCKKPFQRYLGLALAFVLCFSLLPSFSTASAAGGGSSGNPYTKTVALADMYVGGYMNYLLHVDAKSTVMSDDGGNTFATGSEDAANLKNTVFSFVDGSPKYDVMSAAAYLAAHKAAGGADFYNRVTGTVLAFPSGHDLEGLILRYDTGYVYITGYPKKPNSGAISETVTFSYNGNYYTVTITAAAGAIKTWPSGSDFVVSHGFGTFLNTDVNRQYALGIDYWNTISTRPFALTHMTTSDNAAANLSTWYPGTGETLIIPYFGTVYSTGAQYRAISVVTKDYNAVVATQQAVSKKLPYFITRSNATTVLPSKDQGGYIAYEAKAEIAGLSLNSAGYGGSANPFVEKLTYIILEGNYDGLPMSTSSSSPFTFPVACALASDGGYLNLSMSVGQTYTLFETLSGSFSHLRSGCMNNVGTVTEQAFADLVWAAAGDLVTISGNEITAVKAGSVTSSTLITFTPGNCGLWPSSGGNGPFSTFITINIVGGVGFKPNEDGDGGSSDVTEGGKYVVQKLVYDSGAWKWETQTVSQNPGTTDILLSLPEGTASGIEITIEDDGEAFSVSGETKVDVSNLLLETGYRIALLDNDSAVTEAEGFYTAPEKFTVTADATSGNSLTVAQQYGSYYNGSNIYDAIDAGVVYQEYRLQKHYYGDNWDDVTGWYSMHDFETLPDSVDDGSITVTYNDDGTITFSGLNGTDTYRIVSKMSGGTLKKADGSYNYDDDLTEQVVGESATVPSTNAVSDAAQTFTFGTEVDLDLKLDSSDYGSGAPTIEFVLKDEDYSDGSTTKYDNGDYLSHDGTGTPTIYDIYADGEKTGYTVEVSGTPEGGYTYIVKQPDGTTSGADSIEYFTVTVIAGDNIDQGPGKNFGIVDGSGGYSLSIVVLKGTVIELEATGEDGYPNVSWSGGSVSGGKITVSSELTLTATASASSGVTPPDTGSVVINNGGGGTVSGITGGETIEEGEQKTINVTPDKGKKVLDVVVNGESAKEDMDGDTLTLTGDGESKNVDVIFTDEGNKIISTPPTTGGSMTITGDIADKSTTGLITAHEPGTKVTVGFEAEDGYFLRDVIINGVSYGAQDLLEIEITEDKEIIPLFSAKVDLNSGDHFAYIIGYVDGTVRPEGNISREEVATIFFRLLTEGSRDIYMSTSNTFSDISGSRWSNTAISTLASAGIVTGKTSTRFDPEALMTRAEFATIASRFSKVAVGSSNFTDIKNHWAETDIINAYLNGWVNGYDDNTFRPNEYITRAEVMALVNRILERNPADAGDLLDGMTTWSDNMNTAKWYYLDVQEATNAHYCDRHGSGAEYWTGLRENFDWSVFER